MITHILLDMDGVLCDFVSAAMRVHGKTFDEAAWPKGRNDLAAILGVTTTAFWQGIDRFDEEQGFWCRLKAYPWLHDLTAMAEPFGFTIATAPSRDSFCAAGKIQWLQRHFGERFSGYMIGCRKELLAGPGRVLIDDRDRECERFTNAGGHAILFPQPWNASHEHSSNALKFVWDELFRLKSE